MSNELANVSTNDADFLDGVNTELVTTDADAYLKEVQTSSGFLERLELAGKPKVNDAGETVLPGGTWFVPGQGKTIKDNFGKTVDVLPLAWRPKAMRFSDGSVTTSYDNNSEIFQDIVEEASIKTDRAPTCSAGITVLVYVPSVERYFELFLGKPSHWLIRQAIVQYLPVMAGERKRGPKTCTLNSQFIKKNTFHQPGAIDCSTPYEGPNREEAVAQVNKFLATKGTDIEVSSDESPSDREV